MLETNPLKRLAWPAARLAVRTRRLVRRVRAGADRSRLLNLAALAVLLGGIILGSQLSGGKAGPEAVAGANGTKVEPASTAPERHGLREPSKRGGRTATT